MEIIKITSVDFKKLKGLKDIRIDFSDTLTAIMGVNGAGKTTVIHALACVFKSNNNYQFRDFFVPNSDSRWDDSKFIVSYKLEGTPTSIEYTKGVQWLPQSNRRPSRDVYYIGIDSCLPEIEKNKSKSDLILYESNELADRAAKKILSYMSIIFNREYDALYDNVLQGAVMEGTPDLKKMKDTQHLSGIKIKDGPKYSSISMGAGEQRVYRLLKVLLEAKPSSLLLIDEIDLLLHISALRKLLEILENEAKNKKMQIVFTTHSLDILKTENVAKIQYIYQDSQKLTVYDQITDDLILDLTGVYKTRPKYRIYVEDTMAKAIVRRLIKHKTGCSMSDFEIITFGAIDNAFTLAASFVLDKNDHNNTIIVLDGDKYTTREEKEKQINAKLSGNEPDSDNNRETALSFIRQFNLPTLSLPPEKFLYDLICSDFPACSPIRKSALRIKVEEDSHNYINKILYQLNLNEDDIVEAIFEECANDTTFIHYLETIEEWIDNCIKEPLSIGK